MRHRIAIAALIGVLSTPAAFAYETGARLQGGQWLGAAGNLVSQNVLGLACLFLGFALGRLL